MNTVATFDLELLQRVRSLNENKDVYGLSNPSNSIFNTLKVVFDGVRPEMTAGGSRQEDGKVFVGKNKFFYRLRSDVQ